VDVENTLLVVMLGAAMFVIGRYIVVIMVMRMRVSVVGEIGSQRHRVDRQAMISVDFVRVRLHGSGRAGPHK
jgi:hypothetical protein